MVKSTAKAASHHPNDALNRSIDVEKFEVQLFRPEGKGTWTYVTIPFSVAEKFGARGRVSVSGKIDELAFRGTLLPHRDNQHILVIKKEVREQLGKQSGDSIGVALELDTAPRIAPLPEELAEALQKSPEIKGTFDKLSYSQQKGFAEWIASAKQAKTRERRTLKALDMIKSGKKLKS